MFCPEVLRPKIIESLADPKQPAYGQVATCDSEGFPQVRTVHLYFLSEHDTLGFPTHKMSPKAQQLMQLPRIAGCYHDPARKHQLRWTGAVRIFSAGGDTDQNTVKSLWSQTRQDVRLAYWKETYEQQSQWNLEVVCPTFCVVVCQPISWDLYQYEDEDYANTVRKTFLLESDSWVEIPSQFPRNQKELKCHSPIWPGLLKSS